jgi:quinol monooxygenase YgiN
MAKPPMVIVAGTFDMEPSERDAFLAEKTQLMERSRTEPGCLEYVFSADPLDPARVRLFELWESSELLADHQAGLRANPPTPGAITPVVSKVALYTATQTEP